VNGLDEHPDSINDAARAMRMAEPGATTAVIVDYPTGYHHGASGLSFADGHSVTHRWNGSTIKPPATGIPPLKKVDASDSVNASSGGPSTLRLKSRLLSPPDFQGSMLLQ